MPTSYNQHVAEGEEILDLLLSGADSDRKVASQELETMTRTTVYDEGIVRKIFTVHSPTPAECAKSVTHSDPVYIADLEVPAVSARVIGLGENVTTEYLEPTRYEVVGARVSTVEYQIDEWHLRNIRPDIRTLVQDKSAKTLHYVEDRAAIAVTDEIVGTAGATGAGGYVQHVGVTGYTRNTLLAFDEIMHNAPGRTLLGHIVLNQTTQLRFGRLTLEDVGPDLVADTLTRRNEATAALFGTDRENGPKVHTTNRKEDVADNVMYGYASEEFLGKFCEFEDLKMFVENERRMISFLAQHAVGFTFGNDAAVNKMTITPA